jgi:hypothetical protein
MKEYDERAKELAEIGRLLLPRLTILGKIHGNGRPWKLAMGRGVTILSCPDCDAQLGIEDVSPADLILTGLFPFDFLGSKEKCVSKTNKSNETGE